MEKNGYIIIGKAIRGRCMYDEESIILRINELCKTNCITYYELANRSNITLSTLMNIINGLVCNPTIRTVYRICMGFGITVQEFFDSDYFGVDFFMDDD